MSNPKMRALPNVEFVHGFPGIPGAPDRPQAAVKGTIELRLGAGGVKAKWVRIELRKVETLPGGGTGNVFYDHIGQSPVNVWQAQGDWESLIAQDFPFSIRIPESIPPSLTLDKNAGIRYELVATVCMKGKKGLFRRRTETQLSANHQLVIDKHEMHSTWPIYSQPDSRTTQLDGLTLTVDRTQSCFGPNDRISVFATLRSESLSTVALRGFQFQLRETTVFRGGHGGTSKKSGGSGAPTVRFHNIADQKIPVNATLYSGTSHRSELGSVIPPNHTTTTVTSARHIDINYSMHITALLENARPVTIDIPVTISNWPRAVSGEVVRRIGHAANLDLQGMSAAQPHAMQALSQTNSANASTNPSQQRRPEAGDASRSQGADEFGVGRNTQNAYGTPSQDPYGQNRFATHAGIGSSSTQDTRPGVHANHSTFSGHDNRAGSQPGTASQDATYSQPGLQSRNASFQANSSNSRSTNGPWRSAEEEKQRLYEAAKAQVDLTQSPPRNTQESSHPSGTNQPPGPRVGWPGAEEEKIRLYEQAQNHAARTQPQAMSPYSGTNSSVPTSSISHGRGVSMDSMRGQSSNFPPTMSAGAALYSSAMSSVNRQPSAQGSQNPGGAGPSFPSAEEEKAAMRYHEAKRAVEIRQTGGPPATALVPTQPTSSAVPSSNPIAYDSLYPNTPPEPVNPSSVQSAISEKERARRAFEERDRAAAAATPSQPPQFSEPPPPSFDQYASQPAFDPNLSEKERMRRAYEAQDAAPQQHYAPPPPLAPQPPQPYPSPPPMHVPTSPPPTDGRQLPRAQPAPPGGSSSHILSAVDEKARLRAQYEAEELAANGPSAPMANGYPSSHSTSNGTSPMNTPTATTETSLHIPPPLAPRPPAEYIQQTRDEDARYSSVTPWESSKTNSNSDFSLSMRPFSPLDLGLENMNKPPLPPKVPMS